jgi:hypothetical protein
MTPTVKVAKKYIHQAQRKFHFYAIIIKNSVLNKKKVLTNDDRGPRSHLMAAERP